MGKILEKEQSAKTNILVVKEVYRNPSEDIEALIHKLTSQELTLQERQKREERILRGEGEHERAGIHEEFCRMRERQEREKKALKEKKKPEKAGKLDENSKIPLIFSILCFCLYAK